MKIFLVGLANGKLLKLSLNKDIPSLLMDHKISFRQLNYCHIQNCIYLIDSNFDFQIFKMRVSEHAPQLTFKGKMVLQVSKL